MANLFRSWRLAVGLLVANLVLVTALASGAGLTAQQLPDPGDGDDDSPYYMHTCSCVRINPDTGECAEWTFAGCPRAKVQTCGAGCP
jgi:hypothetical protein